MSITENQLQDVIGQDVYSADGAKIGHAGQIFLDDVTGKPEWATVQTGLFGTKESFVPIATADLTSDGLRVPFDKDTVKAAPRVDAEGGHLSQDEEAELYRHYGMDYSDEQSDSGLPAAGTAPTSGRGDHDGDGVFDDVQGRTVGQDTSGLTTDDAMTRSEEQLKVGTKNVAAGKARLRKFVVTEQQTVTVPVTREEVRLEREPISQADQATMAKAMDGPAISEEEHELVLHEEQVVVTKEAVPVERVKLGVETVTEDQQVTEEVRKEQIESSTDLDRDPKTDPRH
ncbi:PRC and DUF2382 domain-containing protein [Dermatophilaceae bacterium Soc4.6]